MKTRILVIGGSFSGLTAAFDLKHALKGNADVTVIDQRDHFVFIPSLVWVIPGWCETERITFDLRKALERRNINFVQARAEQIKPEWNQVCTTVGNFSYDYLVVATGADPDWDAVPGLGPHTGYTQSVCTLPHALEGQKAWEELLEDPGPVVMGATQGASCFGAEYEVAFNLELALRQAGVRDRAPVVFLTAEPFVGHLGFGGFGNGKNMVEATFKRQNIEYVTNAVVEQVTPNMVHLADGRVIPFKYAMFIPPFKGTDAFKQSPGLANARGFIPVNNHYQHCSYPNIYAAGVVVEAHAPEATPVPCGVPKTGLMCEMMAATAAHNIIAELTGKQPKELPFTDLKTMCVMDTGDQAFMVASDRVFSPRKIEIFNLAPWWHWFKLGFERYHMWKMRTGRVYLP